MAAADYKILIEAVDKTRRPLSNIEKSLDRLERKSTQTQGIIGKLGPALAAIGSGAALKGIVNVTARYEDLQTTLNSVTGSAQKGGDAFKFINKFATKTQFGIEDLGLFQELHAVHPFHPHIRYDQVKVGLPNDRHGFFA